MLVLLLAALPAAADTVIQHENVRYEYARVLRVTPVYQTLTATRMERQCDREATENPSRLSRVIGTVRETLSRRDTPAVGDNCRMVRVERQFQRPIAYDVDYTYRGAKYRSRLADDPGHLLRIRISVMPVP